MIDTLRKIETPEGIELELRVVGPIPRGLAWILDSLIRLVIIMIISILFSTLGRAGAGMVYISLFIVWWFYPILFEVYRNGSTPGKKVFGIMVVNDDGTPVTWGASMTRNLLRVADFMPLMYGFGLVSTLINRDFKRLGDIAAKTVVVYKDFAKINSALPVATPKPSPISLTLDEQRAIINFSERSQRLSEERAVELANMAQPLTKNKDKAGVLYLHQIANYLVGAR